MNFWLRKLFKHAGNQSFMQRFAQTANHALIKVTTNVAMLANLLYLVVEFIPEIFTTI